MEESRTYVGTSDVNGLEYMVTVYGDLAQLAVRDREGRWSPPVLTLHRVD